MTTQQNIIPFPYRELYEKRKDKIRSQGFDPELNTYDLDTLTAFYDDALEIYADYTFGIDPLLTVAEAIAAQRVMRDIERCLIHRKVLYSIDDNMMLSIFE
jgi:hypothetical protein